MKVLAVAEKPSVAKAVAQILGQGNVTRRGTQATYISNWDFSYRLHGNGAYTDFTVTSVAGHLKSSDFTEQHRKWHSCDPFALFDAPISHFVADNMKGVERNLQQEARSATELMIWTDCDREGEHIGSEIVSVCRKVKPNIRITRARFSALIPAQIHNAARNTVALDMNQAAAVETRIELDLRIGAALTRLQTVTLQGAFAGTIEGVVSYGSCQFPTLGFVVERYNEVQNFRPEPFWYIHVALERDDHKVAFNWQRHRLFDYAAAFVLFEQCVEAPEATVTSVTNKPTQKWKPLPLTTVELQKGGSRLLRLPPKRVLEIAEGLYQKGFVSYPRTETDQYDRAFNFQELIDRQKESPSWGQFATMLSNGGFESPRNGRKNDQAHPPIHPVNYAGNLQGDDKRVYEFIVRRFLANCSRNATGAETVVEADVAGERFTAKGLIVLQRNYLEVYPYDKWNGQQLPNFQNGERFMPTVCELKEGSTTSPNLLTEADLVGLMDKNGIGTDATIAEHISKIIEREYVMRQREGRIDYLVPSTLGIGLVEGYNRIGFDKSLSKPHLRAETEQRMAAICAGQTTKNDVLQQSCDEYRELFLKTRQNLQTLIETVRQFIEGNGDEGAFPHVQGNNGDNDDDAFDDGYQGDDDNNNGPPAGGQGRGRGRGRGNAQAGRGAPPGRGTHANRGRGVPPRPPNRAPRPPSDDDDNNGDDNRGPPRAGGAVRNTHANSNGPQCGCGEAAVQKTTRKEGANFGRVFWSCPKPFNDGNCNFFEWCDDNGPAAPASRPVPRKRTAAEAMEHADPADTPRCKCDLMAASRVTQKAPNTGRAFFTCSKVSQSVRCDFFMWADEAGTSAAGRGGNGAGSNNARSARGDGNDSGCFTCGSNDHWASACPSKGGGASGSATTSSVYTCYRCGQEGHMASSCSNADNGGQTYRGRGSKRARGNYSSRKSSTGRSRGRGTRGRGRGKGRGSARSYDSGDDGEGDYGNEYDD